MSGMPIAVSGVAASLLDPPQAPPAGVDGSLSTRSFESALAAATGTARTPASEAPAVVSSPTSGSALASAVVTSGTSTEPLAPATEQAPPQPTSTGRAPGSQAPDSQAPDSRAPVNSRLRRQSATPQPQAGAVGTPRHKATTQVPAAPTASDANQLGPRTAGVLARQGRPTPAASPGETGPTGQGRAKVVAEPVHTSTARHRGTTGVHNPQPVHRAPQPLSPDQVASAAPMAPGGLPTTHGATNTSKGPRGAVTAPSGTNSPPTTSLHRGTVHTMGTAGTSTPDAPSSATPAIQGATRSNDPAAQPTDTLAGHRDGPRQSGSDRSTGATVVPAAATTKGAASDVAPASGAANHEPAAPGRRAGPSTDPVADPVTSSAIGQERPPSATQAPPAQSAQSSTSMPGVAGQLVRVLSAPRPLADGSYEVTVALHPESLGTVQATVSASETQLTVRLVAATAEGSAALRQALPELHEALGAGGHRTSVTIGDTGSGASGQSSQGAANRQGMTTQTQRTTHPASQDSSPSPHTTAQVPVSSLLSGISGEGTTGRLIDVHV